MRFSVLASLPFALVLGSSPAVSAPVQWGANGHYYDVVTTPLLATAAEAAAEASTFMGMSGYLATITSASEWSFVLGLLNTSGLPSAIIGISDRDVEGTFKYIGGPEEGSVASYLLWNGGEPNDFSGEDYVEMFAASGFFNDIHPPGTTYDASRGYIVEYSSSPEVIPLPAAGWLMLAGLGGLAALRRRKTN